MKIESFVVVLVVLVVSCCAPANFNGLTVMSPHPEISIFHFVQFSHKTDVIMWRIG